MNIEKLVEVVRTYWAPKIQTDEDFPSTCYVYVNSKQFKDGKKLVVFLRSDIKGPILDKFFSMGEEQQLPDTSAWFPEWCVGHQILEDFMGEDKIMVKVTPLFFM